MIELTHDHLERLVGPELADQWHDRIGQAAQQFGINTYMRLAHWLAQILHESGGLRYTEELWGPTDPQRAYEPPSRMAQSLGNTEEGDGYKYRGRGLIQLTGRANYEDFARELGDDGDLGILDNPGMVASIWPATVAGWFWDRHSLNVLADKDDLEGITMVINGGLRGLADRRSWLIRARQVLDPEPYDLVGEYDLLVFHGVSRLALIRAAVASNSDVIKVPGRWRVRSAPMTEREGLKLNLTAQEED